MEKGLLSMKENNNKWYNELQVHAKFNLPDKYCMPYYRYLTILSVNVTGRFEILPFSSVESRKVSKVANNSFYQ